MNRVAVVSDAVHPWHVGGKETRYRRLVEGLDAAGVQVHVYTMRWWGEGSSNQRIAHTALTPLVPMYRNGKRSVWQGARFALGCMKLLTVRADVIEADQMPGLQIYPLRLVAFLRRIPLVVTWHEVWGEEYWKEYLGPLGRVAAMVERCAARSASCIVAASEQTAMRLRDIGIHAERIVVIPNGVGDGGTYDQYDAPNEKRGLLYVGRLIAHKRVDVAIHALSILRETDPSLTLEIIGDGPERVALESLVHDLGLQDAVCFVGAVERDEDVLTAMRNAAVFITPSEREGFGISIAEALTCGTPVVTSDHPENAGRNLVSASVTGAIAAAGDPHSFAVGVRSCLKLSGVRAAFAAQHPDLTWTAAVEAYLDTYRRVLGGSGR